MNYVPHFNILGVDAKQIPCITGTGAPTTATEGAVGCFYMDTDSGDVYKCTNVKDGVYYWEDVKGEIEVKETVVGDLQDILAYDKNGNATTDIEEVHTGLFKISMKYTSDDPDVICIPPEEYLLMEQRITVLDDVGQKELTQTILRNNRVYTRSVGDLEVFLSGEERLGTFESVNLSPIDNLESKDASAPLSANMGRKLNDEKEAISNKSTVIDETADNTKYPTTKAVKDYVDFPYANYGLPIVYFEGDITGMNKDNKVNLNYNYVYTTTKDGISTTETKTGTCTLKWQGTSSLSYPKKNYTVVFDNAFEAVKGWGEQTKYCLKADWIDFSHCRNVVSAKLWGDVVRTRASSDLVTRLSVLPNCGAIDGFPCFVVVNGEWQGIYNFNIPKEGYMFGMGTGEKEAIICAEGRKAPYATEFKAEATIGTDFDLEYSSDDWTADDIQTSLNTLINACINSDGTDIDTVISQYVDIDSAIDYMIFANLICHTDGIAKNYLLATYDGVKWFFSAYDMDGVFGLSWDGKRYYDISQNEFGTGHVLFNLLYKYKFDRICERFYELISTYGALSTNSVCNKFYNYVASIPMQAFISEEKLWKNIPNTKTNNVAHVQDWYVRRINHMQELVSTDEEKYGTNGLSYINTSATSCNCNGRGTAYTEKNINVGRITKNNVPVYNIAANAFKDDKIIESLSIGATIMKVDNYSFMGCTALEDIKISRDLEVINYGAFQKCTSLKALNLINEDGNSKVRYISGASFLGCTALVTLVLPVSLTEIKSNAFKDCTSLKDIFYAGTMTQWEAIAKDDGWDTNTGDYTIHCTDGDIAKATTTE